ncbi:hypothetical protein AAMO2058_001683200 [Amorphochlora amoebiformis]|mmetsp:Transcript_33119/g.53200  ORF Transcript_33119/g.53200 Transcript_33119/m.53200 type:complete len:831 (-) Transcript_33119:145-2637(-)
MPATETTCLLPSGRMSSSVLLWRFLKGGLAGILVVACLVAANSLLKIHHSPAPNKNIPHTHSIPQKPTSDAPNPTKGSPTSTSPPPSHTKAKSKTLLNFSVAMGEMFETGKHPLKPKNTRMSRSQAAFPTNIWWQNLLLEGNAPVIPLPYAVRALPEEIQICYPERLVNPTNLSVIAGFNPDISLSVGTSGDSPVVTGYDDLSVTFEYPGKMKVPLVRGNPFITFSITKGRPVISTGRVMIKSLEIPEIPSPKTLPEGFSVHQILLGNGQNWLIYARPALPIEWTNTTHLQLDPNIKEYTGDIRIGMLSCGAPSMPWNPSKFTVCESDAIKEIIPMLDRYPVGGNVIIKKSSGDTAEIRYKWETRGTQDQPFLTSILPHHVLMLPQGQAMTLRKPTMVINTWQTHLNHETIKGPITPVKIVGDATLRFSLDLPKAAFYDDVDDTSPHNLQNLSVPQIYVNGLIDALKSDINRNGTEKTDDTYHFGKAMARLARLALIANRLGDQKSVHQAMDVIEGKITSWLQGDHINNTMLYDEVWGGIVVKKGFKEPIWDYGNAYYNDHHYHYGYIIYALAVWKYLRPDTSKVLGGKFERYAREFVADIASEKRGLRFPKARHKDFFDGHSWASGLFKMMDGREQESCSEAVHAYYAVSLMGRVLKDPKMETTGRVLCGMEIQAARTYYQIPGLAIETYPSLFPGGLYPPIFSRSAMVGVMGGNMASHTTWFGSNVEFVHGIQMIPFSPVTPDLLPTTFVQREFGQLAASLVRTDPKIMPSWEGYVRMAQAIIDPKGALWGLQTLDPAQFDDGNSYTNALFWIMSRPNAAAALRTAMM